MIPINDKSSDDLPGPEIEDAIAEALQGVSADDWDSLPADLTEQLDNYLYGDEHG